MASLSLKNVISILMVVAVKDFNLEIADKNLSSCRPSGCGKSTTLRMM
ncbi:MAG: hypothetical protein ACLVB3_09485 [Clostridium sp.]